MYFYTINAGCVIKPGNTIIFLFFLFLLSFSSYGQQGEEGYDCTYSKEIIVPYNSAGGIKHSLNQTVFYSYRDQYTFWYKIVAKENATLSFKVIPINDSDSYVVYVYQYDEKDFCNKLYTKKIFPVKSSFFTGKVSKEDPYNLSQKTFNAKKDNIYYISVLNTSLNNCGHNFKLAHGEDTLKIKAVHIPCKKDFSTLDIKSVAVPVKRDTPVVKIVATETVSAAPPADTSRTNILLCSVRDHQKNTLLKMKPVIIDQDNGSELELSETAGGEWQCQVEKEKTYKVKCSSLGYKKTEQSVKISSAFTRLDLKMQALKAGDVFVMKTIYFYPNTYALKKEAAPELEKLLNFLQENEKIAIEIQGHTNGDNRVVRNKNYESLGEEWNFQGSARDLSQKRAEVIKKYLENNGIAADRLVPKGYGGRKPIILDPQDNTEGQMNIRVEIEILKS